MLKATWRFRAFIRPFLHPFLIGALLVIGETVMDLAQPWPLKVIIDGAINHKPQHGWFASLIAGPHATPNAIIARALVATAIFTAGSAACDYASGLLMNGAGERVLARIRAALFSHMQRLSLAYHSRQRVGDLVGRLTLDLDRVQNMLVAIFDTLLPSSLMLAGLAAAMLLIDPGFGLLALSIAPPLFFVTYRFTMRIKLATRRAREEDAHIAASASETLNSIRLVQSFSREDHEDARFAARNARSLDAGIEAVRVKSAFTPLVDMVALVGTLLVTYVGATRVVNGEMTLGLLLVFLNYLKSLYKPMRALSKLAYTVSLGTTSADRVHEVLSVDERIPDQAHAIPAPRLTGRIELRDVTFGYDQRRTPVLSHASLRIEAGEKIGIIGPTGAGKSTLVALIPRFYDPEHGAVLLDGIDIRGLQLHTIRRQVSLVLQEPILLYGSILDNIRYGDPNASMEQIVEAAHAAHVTEFVDQLPDGFHTMVGERGATLSGGQRQRISIARAILADAPILVLDEPTTGLDRVSEALVLDGLARLSANRTTLVISHHDTALLNVDRIVQLVDGEIVEVGGPRNPGGVVLKPEPGLHMAESSARRREETETNGTICDYSDPTSQTKEPSRTLPQSSDLARSSAVFRSPVPDGRRAFDLMPTVTESNRWTITARRARVAEIWKQVGTRTRSVADGNDR